MEQNKETEDKMRIGRVPVMVRSKFCALHNKEDKERIAHKECVFD